MRIDYLPPEQVLPAERVAVMRAAMEAYAAAHPPRRRWWRRRTLLGGVGALVLLVGAGGTALAVVLLQSKPVTDRSQARCYTVATYTSGKSFPGSSIGEASQGSERGRVENALEVCAAMWRAGILQPGAPRAVVNPGKPQYPVPALVGCVLPGGAAAVFPGPPDTCQRVGLPGESPPAVSPAQAGPSPSPGPTQ